MTWPTHIAPEVDGVSTAHLPMQQTSGSIGGMTHEQHDLWYRAMRAAYADQPFWLYRQYAADGALLYVGLTQNLKQRSAGHRSGSPWWPLIERVDVVEYPNLHDGEAAERFAISTEAPLYNVIHSADADAARARRRELAA